MGFPIRISTDRCLFGDSPRLFAAYYVLHRRLVPGHPLFTLYSLIAPCLFSVTSLRSFYLLFYSLLQLFVGLKSFQRYISVNQEEYEYTFSPYKRRCFNHSFRYGRLVTTSPSLPTLPSLSSPLAGWSNNFRQNQLGWCDGRCVQGPRTYSPQHADLRLLAIPASCTRVAGCNPN